jgi:hypothetical protein
MVYGAVETVAVLPQGPETNVKVPPSRVPLVEPLVSETPASPLKRHVTPASVNVISALTPSRAVAGGPAEAARNPTDHGSVPVEGTTVGWPRAFLRHVNVAALTPASVVEASVPTVYPLAAA